MTLADVTITQVHTVTVTSSLALAVSYVEVTVTVSQHSQATLAHSASLSQAQSVTSLASLRATSTTADVSLSRTTLSAAASASAQWQTYSSSLGTNLGLAIGIPMAVVALVAVLCVGWVIYRKVRSRLRDVLTEQRDWAADGTSSDGWVAQPEAPKRTLLNRLSRIVEWPASPASLRPPILRRFHLLAAGKLPPPPTPPPEKPDATRVVARPYTKRLGDELTLVAGQKVKLIKMHLDGWALVNLDGAEGVVPMACLKRP